MDRSPLLLYAAVHMRDSSRSVRHLLHSLPEQFWTWRDGDVVDSKSTTGLCFLLVYVR